MKQNTCAYGQHIKVVQQNIYILEGTI